MRNCYRFVIPLRPELLPEHPILNVGGDILQLHRFVMKSISGTMRQKSAQRRLLRPRQSFFMT
jgi:hypothetical protein